MVPKSYDNGVRDKAIERLEAVAEKMEDFMGSLPCKTHRLWLRLQWGLLTANMLALTGFALWVIRMGG